jgi:type VI secretion system protein ImpL
MDTVMRHWWTLAGTAAAVLALLGAVGLPILFPALRANGVRLSLVALVAAGLVGAAAWRRWRGRRGAAALADGIADEVDAADAEQAVLGQRMRDALAHLRREAGGRRDYLYARPWYVIIGPPGAGKTTALLRSGVRFPAHDAALAGVGGTRDLDFWFADEAVLVDTAGRYTTQDSDRAVDAAGWARFLRLLRRTRPAEPINGIIVALALDTLIAADRAELDAQIGAIRRRLEELARALQVEAPVYLLLTKADLVAGFTEFFADLAAEGRRAALGTTLDPDRPADAAALIAGYDAMVEALAARTAKRLHEEPDQRARGLILGFPGQWLALRRRLHYLADGILAAGTMGAGVRGLYLTSGTQEGAPLDRVLHAMAAAYHAPTAAPRAGQGRAYFLHRPLTEVIFAEAGRVRLAPAARRRRRFALAGAGTALALAALTLAALEVNAFARNKALQVALLREADAAGVQARRDGIDLVEVRDSDPDLEQALPLLDRLAALPRGHDDQARGAPAVTMRLGLYQSGHADTARLAYGETVQRVLLPRLLLRAERVLREGQADPVRLYAPLKAYLMLGGTGPLDARAVRAWVVDDWRDAALPGADRAEVRARLAAHLDALLADPDLGRVWPQRRAPLDAALIASSRAALATLPLADRAYAVLRARADATGRPDWRADAVLASGDRRAFRNGDAVLGATIPWFLTRAGYAAAYRPGLRSVRAELDRDLWVFGSDAATRSIRDQLPTLRGAIAARYASAYIAAWDALLALPQPADYFGDRAALGAIARDPSPLKTLLIEARRQTMLGGAATGAARDDAAATIRAHFAPVADFAGGGSGGEAGGSAAPVDALLAAVRQAAAADAASRAPGAALSGGAVQGQLATALGTLATAGVSAPPQLKPFVDGAARSGAGAATRAARGALERDYAAQVLPACRAASDDRYPFVAAARQDADPAELHRVYGINGVADQFARDRLAPVLDTGAAAWRWRRDDPVAAGFAASSAAQWQRAAALRDLLARGLALDVALADVGGDVTAVELAAGGVSYRLDPGAAGQRPLLWNLATLPAARLVLFAGAREARRFEARGAFALFRLLDAARVENAGPDRIRATFGEGAQAATLAIDLPPGSNPFSRGGPFAFRCPARL